MGGVVAMPECADANDHRVTRVAGGRAEEGHFALRVCNAREGFSVGAGRGTDVVPAAVKHDEARAVAENKRSLQAALRFGGLWVGAHGDARRFPIGFGKRGVFPAVKEACVARLFRPANAGPKLPRAIGGLPDGEVDRLLFWIGEIPEIRIARDLPPIANDARFLRLVSGVERRGGDSERDEEEVERFHHQLRSRSARGQSLILRLSIYAD